MTRLIDADALKLSHCKECTLYPDKCMGKDCDWGAIIHINEMPAIDAVPVIRCKDCRYFSTGQNECETWSTCRVHINRPFETFEDGYCAWAEPKDTTEEVRKQLKDMEQRREMDRKK